jgi:hypothetical protein
MKRCVLPKFKDVVTSRGVLVIAQGHKRGIRFFYCNTDNVLKCPHSIESNIEILHSMYFTCETDSGYVAWYEKRIKELYIEVDGSVITKDVWGFVEPEDLIRHDCRCCLVFMPLTKNL